MNAQPAPLNPALIERFEAEFAALEDHALEHDLCLLAGNLNAAGYRFCRMIAECDRRRIWAAQGAKSCAAWLGFVCSLSAHAAREKLRVGHALPGLPLLSAAFAAGEVSFSKVRAITRVATAENEAYLLSIARYGTAGHVESLVTAYRGAVRAIETERARRQHEQRRLEWQVDEDGMLVIRVRLAPETGALVIKAIEMAIDDAEAEHIDDDEPGTDNPLSPRFDPRPANEHDSSQVHGPSQVEVINHTTGMRRADAFARLADAYLGSQASSKAISEHYQVMVHVDAEVLRDPGLPGRCEIDGVSTLAAESVRRIACDSSVTSLLGRTGKPGAQILDIGRKSRAIPPSMRRALHARDDGCRFPGCTAKHRVEGHHIHHWANGGVTAIGNLISLCRFHHHLVHEGGYTIERAVAGGVRFLRPDGSRVPQVAPPVFATRTLADELRAQEIHIDHRTGRPRWDGAVMDRQLAVQLLFERTNATAT